MITNAMILCRGTLELYLFSITDCLSPSDEQHGDRQAGYSPGITEEEVNADQQEGDNHPRNSVIDQLLAADPVDDHKSKNGGQSVD